jgi:predicted TIM-barrel fold metal-dependent hydrolase
MKLIDIHTHIYPDEIAQKAADSIRDFYQIGGSSSTDGTVRMLLERGGQAGISQYVILPVAIRPDRVQGINNFIHQKAQEHDCMIPFGTVHAAMEGMTEEVDRIFAMGMKGIKLHPVYQGVELDDPRYLRILELAGESELIVVTHGGIDIGYPESQHAAPDKLLHAVRQVGPVKLVAAHMGGWKQWDEAEALADTSVYLDTSFSAGFITAKNDGHYRPEELNLLGQGQFMRMVRIFGADRILFGTDSPWTDQEENVRLIRALSLTVEEQAAILGGNAEKLLKQMS